MLIVRTPVRISLAGGGTDLAAYYRRHPGLVVSATIDKYFYVFVTRTGEPGVQLASSDFRTFSRHRRGEPVLWDSDLALPRTVLRHFGVESGIHVFLASEVPPGTGLGSSSAVAVGLIKALATFSGRVLSRAEIAAMACHVEIDLLGAPIGRQDQYAAAFGGLNAITFTPTETHVEPIHLALPVLQELEASLALYFTGSSRRASEILQEQQRRTEHDPAAIAALDTMRDHAEQMRVALQAGSVVEVGRLLHDSWMLKRGLARNVTTSRIDTAYHLARRHGALGGKIAGAGGGGFLLLFCEPGARPAVDSALVGLGLYRMDFRFETGGARVLVNAMPRAGLALPASPLIEVAR